MNLKSFSKGAFGAKAKWALICVIAVLAFGLLSVGCRRNAGNPALNFAPVPDTLPQNSYADLVGKVAPAVITIRANKRVRNAQQFDFFNNPFFRDLFGDRGQQQSPQESLERALGSGVIVSTDGYILTNHHVIDGAQDIKVDLNDGRTFDAKLIGSDSPSDLALLKVNASGLTFMTPGDSDRVRVGDIALAIGNPLGIGQTVTMGIISAKGRSSPQGSPGSGNFEDFLQTDAPINRGNSGGALINTIGELIGINSQIMPGAGGGNIGIGFAIPSNMARSVMDQLVKNGKVRRGQLGIVVSRVTSDLASSLGMPEAKGVIVNSVRAGSAAEKAGIRRGDIITAINDTAMSDSNAFRNRVASNAPGSEVILTVLRDNKEQKIRATLGEFNPETAQTENQNEGAPNSKGGAGKLGLSVEPLTPELAQELGLPSGTQGVVVDSADPTGPAGAAGIRRGDVILEVNRQPVRSADELRAAIDKNGDKPSLLLINRRGETAYIPVRPNQ